jgi:pyridoxal phosphate enzyme (YggS family)
MAEADQIAERLDVVRTRIVRAGGESVRIIGVTKRHPAATVVAAAAAGLTDLAENYAQEMAAKLAEPAIEALGVRWHFVGQLQTNKVRVVADDVDVFHTVDRQSLVKELTRRAPGAAVLVQVDLAGTGAGRGGIHWDDAADLVADASAAGLDVVGLMGVAPAVDPDSGFGPVDAVFARLAGLRSELGLRELSIGMSDDLESAVSAGATMVRLGTALFGPRQ